MATKTTTKASARERLLEAANELFYGEGVQTVGIDRVIEHAGVAKASLYNTFGSKEGLVCAYLDLRYVRMKDRITRTLTRYRTPREQLLGVFDALGEAITDPEYNGCAFVRATAETAEDSSIRQVADNYRLWMRGLFTELATASGFAAPDTLARQLHLLYDGAGQSARMDRDPSAATTARAAAAILLDAAARADSTTAS
ncbi:TetR/AcrR family transcriptional regulator [Streptomyces adustus]|uniref:TetR/AcrR family transcriptional regulator n=1 Tax=Streptomyces adustus TaxID=1609272 RepID=A0A5N8VEB1_9ACTN|nr:TetR/AcrR family transcriptional regulator [Streptomyces adustus]MPY33379.1 TetR/AcrR family transcriptional regulator [Streptomyces adustus]